MIQIQTTMKISKSILLIEDDKDDQLFFTECLEKIENATLFDIANNGREALDKLEKSINLPDMIFMDINMPLMNGLNCLTEINKDPRTKNIPVVMLSTDAEQAEQARTRGAKAFKKKPGSFAILQSRVEQLINLDFISNASFANQTFQTAQYAE